MDDYTIDDVLDRARQEKLPDQRRTDSEENQQWVLDTLTMAVYYEGSEGSLIDAIMAEPHYRSPSIGARRISAGQVARELREMHEYISVTGSIDKTAFSRVIREWAVEMRGYASAVAGQRVAPHMGEAIRMVYYFDPYS